MQARFACHDIRDVCRVSAIDGARLNLPTTWRYSAGAFGCLQSHLHLARDARSRCLPDLLILEDDVLFDPCFRDKFPEFAKGLPADWDMIFLGALHREDPIPVARNVCRIRQAYSTYAYALRNTIFDAFIAINERAECPVDVNNFILQAQYKCYCFMPNLAWVDAGYSHVQERVVDHWYLRESVVTLGSEMDHILRHTLVVIAHNNSDGASDSQKNLMFLAQFYDEFLEGIRTCVVEQGDQGTVNPSQLPAGCQYLLLKEAGPFDRIRCFTAALECASADYEYIILSDSNLFIDALNIRANLRMCQRCDCATGLKHILELTQKDTENVRHNKFAKGIDLEGCRQSAEQVPFASYGLFRRDVFRARGWRLDDILAKPINHSTPEAERRLRVFESPNHALRLRH